MTECGAATFVISSVIGSLISSSRSSDRPRSPSSDFASPLSLALPLLVLRRSLLSRMLSWLRSMATKDLGSLTLDLCQRSYIIKVESQRLTCETWRAVSQALPSSPGEVSRYDVARSQSCGVSRVVYCDVSSGAKVQKQRKLTRPVVRRRGNQAIM